MMQKFHDYQPTKGTIVWTAIGASVLTMIIGFTVGGWVTGGSAMSMAEEAKEGGQEQLVASICVDKFASAPNAAENFVKLKEASSYERDNFITDGGWSEIAALDDQISGAADLCAEQLAELDELPNVPTETASEEVSAEDAPAEEDDALAESTDESVGETTEETTSEGENAG